jgi:hypothetical protein
VYAFAKGTTEMFSYNLSVNDFLANTPKIFDARFLGEQGLEIIIGRWPLQLIWAKIVKTIALKPIRLCHLPESQESRFLLGFFPVTFISHHQDSHFQRKTCIRREDRDVESVVQAIDDSDELNGVFYHRNREEDGEKSDITENTKNLPFQ